MYFKVHPVVEAGKHTSPALKLAICLKNSKNLNLQIAQISLFQMRYDSLPNSKKWPSDSPKGSATPCFLLTHSVVLLMLQCNPVNGSPDNGSILLLVQI